MTPGLPISVRGVLRAREGNGHMLTLLLLALAGQVYPATADTPDTAPASAPVVLEVRTWTGLKQAFTTIPIPAHADDDDERGLR